MQGWAVGRGARNLFMIVLARQTIDAVPSRHPFELRHHEVKPVDWESCARVLDDEARTEALARGWRQA